MSLTTYLKPVGCLSPRATCLDAATEMKARNIGAVVVVSDDQRAIGILTDRDLALRVMAEGRAADQTSVEDAMTRGLACLPENATLAEATELMRDRGVRRLPILDAAGKVTGIVSLDDLLLLLGMELGNLASALFTEFSELSQGAEVEQSTA